MATVRTIVAGFLAFTTALSSPALAAQSPSRHLVDRASLAATLAERVAEEAADRAAVQEALARPEVRGVAAKAGANLDRIAAQVATLEGADLAQAADAARKVNDRFVGGASITLSTTTIIIALLVIILIIVAVD